MLVYQRVMCMSIQPFFQSPFPLGFRRSERMRCFSVCAYSILQPQKFPKGLHRWLAESTAGPQVTSLQQMTSIHDQN